MDIGIFRSFQITYAPFCCIVTESLAAFMTAEQMVAGQKSVTDSEIEHAMQEAGARQANVNTRNNAKGKTDSGF